MEQCDSRVSVFLLAVWIGICIYVDGGIRESDANVCHI